LFALQLRLLPAGDFLTLLTGKLFLLLDSLLFLLLLRYLLPFPAGLIFLFPAGLLLFPSEGLLFAQFFRRFLAQPGEFGLLARDLGPRLSLDDLSGAANQLAPRSDVQRLRSAFRDQAPAIFIEPHPPVVLARWNSVNVGMVFHRVPDGHHVHESPVAGKLKEACAPEVAHGPGEPHGHALRAVNVRGARYPGSARTHRAGGHHREPVRGRCYFSAIAPRQRNDPPVVGSRLQAFVQGMEIAGDPRPEGDVPEPVVPRYQEIVASDLAVGGPAEHEVPVFSEHGRADATAAGRRDEHRRARLGEPVNPERRCRARRAVCADACVPCFHAPVIGTCAEAVHGNLPKRSREGAFNAPERRVAGYLHDIFGREPVLGPSQVYDGRLHAVRHDFVVAGIEEPQRQVPDDAEFPDVAVFRRARSCIECPDAPVVGPLREILDV